MPVKEYSPEELHQATQADTGTAPQEDDRNAIQRGFDKLTTVTPEQEEGHSPIVNKMQEFGAGAIQGAGQPFVHPIDTIEGVGHALMHPIDTAVSMRDQAKEHPAQALGNLAGGAGLGMAGEAGLGKLMSKTSLPERLGGYKSPVIDPALQNASKVAMSIRPPTGIPYGLESDLASELPAIKGFAAKTGNPFHSQWEGAQAAKGAGEEGLQHFNQNILGPNAEARIEVGTGNPSQGFTGPRAGAPEYKTLGQINNRISEINDLMRPANNAKTAGAAMTAMERQGLESEASFLRNKLYDELSKRTGISPEDIKSHREGYGKQFGIADTIDSARRARMGQMGAAAEGSSVPLDKSGMAQKAITTLRGGQQYLADRNFRNATKPFMAAPREFPQPQYPQPLQGDEFNNPFLNKNRGAFSRNQ